MIYYSVKMGNIGNNLNLENGKVNFGISFWHTICIFQTLKSCEQRKYSGKKNNDDNILKAKSVQYILWS